MSSGFRLVLISKFNFRWSVLSNAVMLLMKSLNVLIIVLAEFILRVNFGINLQRKKECVVRC